MSLPSNVPCFGFSFSFILSSFGVFLCLGHGLGFATLGSLGGLHHKSLLAKSRKYELYVQIYIHSYNTIHVPIFYTYIYVSHWLLVTWEIHSLWIFGLWLSTRLTTRLTTRLPDRLTTRLPDRLTTRLPDRLLDRLTTRLPDRLTTRLPDMLTTRLSNRLTKPWITNTTISKKMKHKIKYDFKTE